MRRLTENDREAMLTLLNENPTVNLFMVGDLEQFGFNTSFVSFYGQYHGDHLATIIMTFRTGIHIYGHQLTSDELEFITHLVADETFTTFNVNDEMLAQIQPLLTARIAEVETCKMAVYQANDFVCDTSHVVALSEADAAAINAVEVSGFGPRELSLPEKEEALRSHSSYCFGIYHEGTLASVATVCAMTQDAGMIVGVATDERFRHRGYASAVVKHLCDWLKEQGRTGVLFYINPVAGAIYHRLGFVDQENYTMIKLSKGA